VLIVSEACLLACLFISPPALNYRARELHRITNFFDIMNGNGALKDRSMRSSEKHANGVFKEQVDSVISMSKEHVGSNKQTTANLLICVGGIYASL